MTIRNLLRVARHSAATLILPGGEAAVSSGKIVRQVMRSDLIADTKRLERLDLRFVPSLVDHTNIRAAPETRVTTLPNGLRVATKSTLAFNNTASVGVWIDAGSRYEAEGTNSTAHFLDQMIFKGNASWPEEIATMGHIDASTSREQTACYAKVFDKDVSKVLEILADILQNSTFDAERIEQARDVILCDMEEGKDQTEEVMEEVILDLLHCAAFRNTPLGRTISGSAENIKLITQEHLKNYMTTHYTASRVVISAAGAVKHEEVVELVDKLFTKMSSNPTTASQLVAKSPASFTGSEVRIIDGDIKMAHFAIAFEGAAATDPDSIALMVMLALLDDFGTMCVGRGKHSGSELEQRVTINDIAESVMVFTNSYKDTGLFGVYAVAKPDCLDDLSYAIMQSISKLSYCVTDDDVTRARNRVKTSLIVRFNGSTPVAMDIGRQIMFYGRLIPAAEFLARIDAVDASTVKRVANQFICDQDVAIAALGPVQSLPDYNWFRCRV